MSKGPGPAASVCKTSQPQDLQWNSPLATDTYSEAYTSFTKGYDAGHWRCVKGLTKR